MKYRTLINILDEFNYSNIIAVLEYMPQDVVFIYEEKDKNSESLERVKQYFKHKFPNTNLKLINLKDINLSEIEYILQEYNPNETLINLSEGDRLLNLLIFQLAIKHKFQTIYIDIEKNIIIKLEDNTVKTIDYDLEELFVEDFIASSGGGIIAETTKIYEDDNMQKLLDFILENYDEWNIFKKLILDINISKHNETYAEIVTINERNIQQHQYKIYNKFINKIKELKLATLRRINGYETLIRFSNSSAKSFIYKTGSWLEALTQRVVKSISDVDDVKSGVLFLWDVNNIYIKNEIDVIATVNSNLFCISCKDTPNYDEDDLNELDVYAEQIGGLGVKKILVTTQEPKKRTVLARAKEMGIKIVIFDGNEIKFRKKLLDVIKTKN